jgi:DNA-directed RNA polymerase specialized sigma24 family protein
MSNSPNSAPDSNSDRSGTLPDFDELYSSLRTKARCLASSADAWLGQEHDAAEDFLQEAVVRTLQQARRAQRGEAAPIKSFKQFAATVMHNYREDKRRRDCRLVRFDQVSVPEAEPVLVDQQVDPEEVVIEQLFREQLFFALAAEIVKFPDKQRTALLIDLANNTDFAGQPTILQCAFLAVGIRLQDYQQPLPKDPVQRSRYASSLNVAYKRVANLTSLEPYKVA